MNKNKKKNRIINPPLLFDILEQQAQFEPSKVALEFEGRSSTFFKLNNFANKTANFLTDNGLRKGDRVVWLANNLDLFWPIFLGAAKAGIVLTPLNWRLSPLEIGSILDDATCSMLLGENEFIQKLQNYSDNIKAPKIITIDESLEKAIEGYEATFVPVTIKPQDTVLQLYTSGTTGLPKGVLLTHRCFEKVAESQFEIGAICPTYEGETILHVLPHFHIAGVTLGLIGWKQSMPILQHRSFDVDRILQEAIRGLPINVFLVPAMINMIVERATSTNVSLNNFVCVSYGAAPMPRSLLEKVLVVMPNASFYQFYGMTETTGGLCVLGASDHVSGATKLTSAGKPIPGCEIIIINPESGENVLSGEVGEILTCSEHLMKGYWNRKDADSESFLEGYYKTGDAGYIDDHGYLYLVDRIKDMIISGGENIYPAELENALSVHPKVSECAFFGILHEKWGEVSCALVVPELGVELNEQEICDFLSTKIAKFKLPHLVVFDKELPRNASGKVLKNKLQDKYRLGLLAVN
jgi:acyl-CoA synthetase (AMP-forming)/AMP-acid ligase II